MACEVPHSPAPNYRFVFYSISPARCAQSSGLLPSALGALPEASHLGHSMFTGCSLLTDSFPRTAPGCCFLFVMSLLKLYLLREPFSVFIAVSPLTLLIFLRSI